MATEAAIEMLKVTAFKLAREVQASFRMFEPLARREIGNTNYNIIVDAAKDVLDALAAAEQVRAPGHTDLMVTPESLDKYLDDNPPIHAGEGPGPSPLAAKLISSPSVSDRGQPAPAIFLRSLADQARAEGKPFEANVLDAAAEKMGEQVRASEWQPIKTAPDDGRLILVWDTRSTPRAVVWQTGRAQLFPGAMQHWMPLPSPPNTPIR